MKPNTLKEPMRYDSTTGLNPDQTLEVVSRIANVLHSRKISLTRHMLGLYRQVQLTLIMLRHNMPQQVMADPHQGSPSQASLGYTVGSCRCSTKYCPSTTPVWQKPSPAARFYSSMEPTHPAGNRPASGLAKANYSGKHKVQCLNIQVASTLEGNLIAVSTPHPPRGSAKWVGEGG